MKRSNHLSSLECDEPPLKRECSCHNETTLCPPMISVIFNIVLENCWNICRNDRRWRGLYHLMHQPMFNLVYNLHYHKECKHEPECFIIGQINYTAPLRKFNVITIDCERRFRRDASRLRDTVPDEEFELFTYSVTAPHKWHSLSYLMGINNALTHLQRICSCDRTHCITIYVFKIPSDKDADEIF